MKVCRICKKEKELDQFSRNLKKKSGLNDECKECQKEYFKKYYAENKAKHIARVKKVNIHNNQYINTYKLERGCSKCGYNKCPAALDFHHKDKKSKEFSVSQFKNAPKEELDKEIAKCIILCANCHREEHYKPRINVQPVKRAMKRKNEGEYKYYKNIPKDKCECGKEKCSISKYCVDCKKNGKYKTTPPISKEELEKLVWEIPSTKIAERYNVSDKTIENWCNKYNIVKPPRGYWTKCHTKN